MPAPEPNPHVDANNARNLTRPSMSFIDACISAPQADHPTAQRASEKAIHDALLHDQCWYGMEHTNEQIALWLYHCDTWGRKALLKRLIKQDAGMDEVGR